jgi:SOS response regulatory protein OraA/RecX
VESDTISSAYDLFVKDCTGLNAEENDVESPEILAVRRYVNGRVHGTVMTAEQRQKIYAGLMRKGFSYEAIRRVLSGYTTEEPVGEDE